MIAIASMLAITWACDEEEATPDRPTITAPAALDVLIGESTDLTFTVSVPGGFKSASVTATGGEAEVSAPLTAGAVSGDIVVTFAANEEAGDATISLTVIDNNDKEDSKEVVVSKGNQVTITSNITTNTTWKTGVVYVLGGRITVVSGVTLMIEPGVVVKGQAGTGANATALLVARGAKLMAEGTAASPIIFTSVADELQPGQIVSPNLEPTVNGLWGGVIILGSAPISASSSGNQLSEVQIEGIPATDSNGLYGGNNKTDNSGIIRYVSIRHGGANIGSGNEINGLTLGGVGSGTVIENIEVVANQDDGIEFFGGTVSVTNALVWNSFDDALDTDQAYNGTVSNFVIVAPNTGSGFELDGPEGTYKDGDHKFMNGTVYAGANIADLIDFDANTNVQMSNIYFYGISNNTDVKEYAAMVAFANSTSSVTAFQYTLPADKSASTVFAGIPAAQLTSVALNGNTVGANLTSFTWTWARQSGALAGIGL